MRKMIFYSKKDTSHNLQIKFLARSTVTPPIHHQKSRKKILGKFYEKELRKCSVEK